MFVLLLSANKDVVNSSQSSKPVKSSEPIGSKESLKDISPNKGKFEMRTKRKFYQCVKFYAHNIMYKLILNFEVKNNPEKNISKTSESKQSSSQKSSKPVDQLSSSMTSATSKNNLSASKDKPSKKRVIQGWHWD